MAGRKGYYDEIMVNKIISKANNIILNTLEGTGKYKDVPIEVKIELAARFALKAVPQQVEGKVTEIRYEEIAHTFKGLDIETLRAIGESSQCRALPAPSA